MATFEGNYDINFDVNKLTDERKDQFVQFIKKWRENHPLGYDNWTENLDYVAMKSEFWGGNDPANIEDLHNFLQDAAKAFPELEADGNGDGADVASGEWETEYKFSLKDGVLEWDENEWSQEKENERSMAGVINKSIPTDFKRNLADIFPNLDESLPNGLIIEDGLLLGIKSEYYDFLGDDSDHSRFYFPPEVEGLDNDFDYFEDGYQWTIDGFVITTNMKGISAYDYSILGFKNFYIIDAETKETVFYTNRFLVPDEAGDGFVYDIKLFTEFADDYYKDQYKAIHNSDYGVAVDHE